MAIDPVCGMTVDEQTAPAKAQYNGTTYYFCAPGCKRTFEKDPEAVLHGGPKGMSSPAPQLVMMMPARQKPAPSVTTVAPSKTAPSVKPVSLTIPIEGMSCASCVAKIEHGLSAVPGLLMAMAWIFVFSPNIGWANALLKSAFGLTEAPVNIYSMAGMTWALSSHYFPLAYLVLGPALRALDVRMEEAALMAGGSYRQVFARVTLPLLRPAILSALLLLFVMGMASYEVPRLIGRPARIDVFTTDIQGAIIAAPPAFGVASALGLTLLAVCVLAVFFYRRATRHAESFATITGKGYRPTRVKLGRARWPVALGVAAMFILALGLPLITLVWQSFFRNLAQPFFSAGARATLDNYEFILSYPIFLAALPPMIELAACFERRSSPALRSSWPGSRSDPYRATASSSTRSPSPRSQSRA